MIEKFLFCVLLFMKACLYNFLCKRLAEDSYFLVSSFNALVHSDDNAKLRTNHASCANQKGLPSFCLFVF